MPHKNFESKLLSSLNVGNISSASAEAQKKQFPDYEETFGHIAEDIIRGSIGERAGLFVEKIEKGTKSEDCRDKVDFWIKFIGIDAPLGIQYTVSDNEDKIRGKRDFLKRHNFLVKKEAHHDSEINWSGNTNVVLIRGDKLKLAKVDRNSREENINPAKLVGDAFIRDFFSQVIIELKEINPIRAKIILEAIRAAHKRASSRQNKRDHFF